MALSQDLLNALIEFNGALKDDDDVKPYVEQALSDMRRAGSESLAAYEDCAFGLLHDLFELHYRHGQPEAKLTDSGKGGDTFAVKQQ